jgi:hypothetical protein
MNITFERFKEKLIEEEPNYSEWAIQSLYKIFSEVCYPKGEFTEKEIWAKDDQCSSIGFYWQEINYLDSDFEHLNLVGTLESKQDDLRKIKDYLVSEQGDTWAFDGEETFIYFNG